MFVIHFVSMKSIIVITNFILGDLDSEASHCQEVTSLFHLISPEKDDRGYKNLEIYVLSDSKQQAREARPQMTSKTSGSQQPTLKPVLWAPDSLDQQKDKKQGFLSGAKMRNDWTVDCLAVPVPPEPIQQKNIESRGSKPGIYELLKNALITAFQY